MGTGLDTDISVQETEFGEHGITGRGFWRPWYSSGLFTSCKDYKGLGRGGCLKAPRLWGLGGGHPDAHLGLGRAHGAARVRLL